MKATDKLQLLLKGVPLSEVQTLEQQLDEEAANPGEGSANVEESSGTFVTKDELTATLDELVSSIQKANIINDSADVNVVNSGVSKASDVLLKNLTGERAGESEEET